MTENPRSFHPMHAPRQSTSINEVMRQVGADTSEKGHIHGKVRGAIKMLLSAVLIVGGVTWYVDYKSKNDQVVAAQKEAAEKAEQAALEKAVQDEIKLKAQMIIRYAAEEEKKESEDRAFQEAQIIINRPLPTPPIGHVKAKRIHQKIRP